MDVLEPELHVGRILLVYLLGTEFKLLLCPWNALEEVELANHEIYPLSLFNLIFEERVDEGDG